MRIAAMKTKPIVVLVDGSDESAAALAWAVGRVAETGEPLRVVTDYEQPCPATDVAGEFWRELIVAKRAARERAEGVLVDVLGHTDVDHILRLGAIERVLVDMSSEASLIVVGHRRSTTWWSRRRGSLADRIKDAAACPVVSVPLGDVLDEPIAA